ncbi:nicotianamine synthase family protein [Vibrio sp. S9_S30]|uniref:nicotianamine synthase family protein n=1 Tax=Vibrio sp. S9_S30 TaxID=2720226 RepID=UPI0016816981|nr:nicotianamine synthase family protein [Vibrio sp. S9_S30]
MTMTSRHYQLLVTISTFESQIHTLTQYSVESCDCFTLLQVKLDELCAWILQEEQQAISNELGFNPEYDRQLKKLRETAVKALCMLEKHQSMCAQNHSLSVSDYLSQLSENTHIELRNAGIENDSRVLFVGSGSYPLSAFTISQLTGAMVHGVDIDEQAVEMANRLKASHLSTTFGCQDLVTEFENFRPTHIVVASLVEHKWELLSQLKPYLNSTHKVMVRFGNGLKSAFNYPFNPYLMDGWQTELIQNKAAVYDTVLMGRE